MKNKGIALALLLGTTSWLGAQNPRLNNYTLGEGLTFTGDKDYEMNLRGYFQPYYEFKNYTDADYPTNPQRFRMRRMRIRLTGDAPRYKVDYRFQADFSGVSETGNADGEETDRLLFDAWIRYSIAKRIRLTFGQRVTQTDNRELWMGSNTLMLVERSRVTSAFASIREFGFFADATLRTGRGTYLRPYFTLTNGDGLNAFARDRGGLKVGGRLDFLPFGLFTNIGQFRQVDVVRELSPKLVIGANYSVNNGMSSRRGRGSGQIFYLNDKNENGMLDAGEERLPNFTKMGVDFMLKYRGFTVIGEFVSTSATVPDDINLRNDIYGADRNALTDRFRGREAVGSETFIDYSPQDYARRQMMLGQGYNIQMGYFFKNRISVDGRYTHINADQHSFLNNETFYNRPNYYTLGISKYFTRGYGFKIQGAVTYVEAGPGSNDINGNPMRGNEWIARIMTTFSF